MQITRLNLILLLIGFAFIPSQAQTVSDIDGNLYNTVTIGNQTWLSENLRTTRFNDGRTIPTTTQATNNLPSSIYQWAYNDDTSNIAKYGRLYTFYVAFDTSNVCPVGWHVPSTQEYDELMNFLGGDTIAGAKLKMTGTATWSQTDSSVTNSSGFGAVGGGFRGNPSGFRQIDTVGCYWSKSPLGINPSFLRGQYYRLSASDNSFTANIAVANFGASIRCIQDLSSSLDEQQKPINLQLFPNPVADQLNLRLDRHDNYQLIIIDALGKEVYQADFSRLEMQIDLSSLAKGSYLLRIFNRSTSIDRPFIKE